MTAYNAVVAALLLVCLASIVLSLQAVLDTTVNCDDGVCPDAWTALGAYAMLAVVTGLGGVILWRLR